MRFERIRNLIEVPVGLIFNFTFQTEEVLIKDSAEELNEGRNPGPMTEICFWEAKCMNLESLFEQVTK